MDECRDTERRPITAEHGCSFCVITFKRLEWIDHTGRILARSTTGIRLESDKPIDPGFVWFSDRVGGHKGGVLMWCKKLGRNYRAGIQFVPLTRDEERRIQERTVRSSSHRPRRSPDEIIAALIESMTRSCE